MTGQVIVDWVPSRGAVRFTLVNAQPGDTVKRIRPGDTLGTIRGYASDAWWNGTAQTIGYDYEMPLGVEVGYAVVAAAATTLPPNSAPVWIFTQSPGTTNGEAWLRDVFQPTLSVPVSFVSSGDEGRPARQTILEIAGRKYPYVVWDVRLSRTGTVQLGVANKIIDGIWTAPSERQKLEALFESGRPLLLSVCYKLGFTPCYMAPGDIVFNRVGTGPLWTLDIPYTEIDVPDSNDIQIAVEVDYALAQTIPNGGATTYADWTTVTYYQIATRRA